VATFEEFRASLPEGNNEKGKCFEYILCHWLLKNHPEFKNRFRKVWNYLEWPKRWYDVDLGTDLIAEDKEGKIWAIQAKCYAEQTYVTKGAVDSFLSDSAKKQIDHRLLIATTDKIGLNATVTIEGQEKPVHLFLLDRFLDPGVVWPKSFDDLKPLRIKPKKPRPHQRKAINEVVKNLSDRGQLIMACGTGKTLVGQRIAEKLESKSTLVLFPSLLLLSKTVNDWLFDKEIEFAFLPVCSDSSVVKGTDVAEITASELSYPSTTDPAQIAKFLKRRGNKVVFSTYQSSPQIAKAMKKHKLPKFDLIIADEAHRCAGKVSSHYSTVLDNALLPAQRRLFMTATPRVFKNNAKKLMADAGIEIASMDDESKFGKELHKLSFGEAIANNLLSDYRVLVIGVNDQMVKEMVTERTLVKTQTGLEQDARSLAIQIGLAKAIKKYDLKRVISFHSRVNLAKNFAKDFHQVLNFLNAKERPKGKLTYEHVNGNMRTSERNAKLRELGDLSEQDRYVLGNARCLSEGVDVPALDGIAFVDPRRSEIDIVQAVGRAIRLDRTNENKIGTIVIPVFIEEGDNPDKEISRSEFDQVWKVVTALRAHDDALGEELDRLRTKLGEHGKISLKGAKIILDIHQSIDRSFTQAFETRIVESSSESWWFWFALLKKYKLSEGHLEMKAKYMTSDGFKLGSWVVNQRTAFDRGMLDKERMKLLEDLGFIWDMNEYLWETQFKALVEFKRKNGHVKVRKDTPLGFWCTTQRAFNKKGALKTDREMKLVNIGFVFDQHELAWQENFSILKKHIEWTGDWETGSSLKNHVGGKMSSWVSQQRKKKVQGTLSVEHESQLEEIAFPWNLREHLFEELVFRLKAHLSEFDDFPSEQYVTKDGYTLGTRVGSLRQRKRKQKLLQDELAALQEINFPWKPRDETWDRGIGLLETLVKSGRDPNVPVSFRTENGYGLGRWLADLRARWRSDRLTANRIKRLKKLGVAKYIDLDTWPEGIKALKRFKKIFIHCDVPRTYEDPLAFPLCNWLGTQRFNRDKLSQERRKELESLGFEWNRREARWERGYQEMKSFIKKNGNTKCSRQHIAESGFNLGNWRSVNLRAFTNLSPERRKKLKAINFS